MILAGQTSGAQSTYVQCWLDAFPVRHPKKGNNMRSRMSALVLSFVLLLALAGCSKKDQSQTQPPATDNTSAQANQMAPNAQQPGQSQMANSAPAQQQQPQ